MSTSDDRIDKLARLERLRKLGVKRGAHNLNAPVQTPERTSAAPRIVVAAAPVLPPAPDILPGEPVDTQP